MNIKINHHGYPPLIDPQNCKHKKIILIVRLDWLKKARVQQSTRKSNKLADETDSQPFSILVRVVISENFRQQCSFICKWDEIRNCFLVQLVRK